MKRTTTKAWARPLAAMVLGLGLAWSAQAAEPDYIDVQKAAQGAGDASSRKFFGELADMHQKLSQVSGIEARLLLSDSDEVNAFATEVKGAKVIVLNMGLIDELGDDRDALVGVLAHEYAHHGKSHISSTRSTNTLFGVLGAIVGGVIDYKLGTGGLGQDIGGAGAKVITRSFSREQERDADALGLQWMVEAGYNPSGAVRAQRKFLALAGGSSGFSLFRTHPGSDERVSNLEGLIAANDKARALQSDARVALSLPEEAPEPQTVAALTRPLPEPAAALLEPVNGMALSRFAQISNDLVFFGEAKGLAKNKLTPARYAQINDAWTARMAQDTSFGLSSAYARHYFEASQGAFAAWGRDVAQSYQSGSLREGAEPLPVDDWAALLKAQQGAVKDGKYDAAAFEQAAKAKGLSPYDFNIVSSWWMQAAKQRAAQGDMSVYQKIR